MGTPIVSRYFNRFHRKRVTSEIASVYPFLIAHKILRRKKALLKNDPLPPPRHGEVFLKVKMTSHEVPNRDKIVALSETRRMMYYMRKSDHSFMVKT